MAKTAAPARIKNKDEAAIMIATRNRIRPEENRGSLHVGANGRSCMDGKYCGLHHSPAPLTCKSAIIAPVRTSGTLAPTFQATGFLNVPTPSTITSIASPATTGPTPLGVPVGIKSPGISVMTCEM